jgi:hypothetical protein
MSYSGAAHGLKMFYRDRVMIRSHDTGLELSPAPEFAEDGSWPPVETDWVPVRWELFETQASDVNSHSVAARILALINSDSSLHDYALLQTEDALSDDFLCAKARLADIALVILDMPGTIPSRRNLTVSIEYVQNSGMESRRHRISGERATNMVSTELRRLVHYLRWRRQEPVIRLPPASTNKIHRSVMTGLSVEQSEMLAQSLGSSLAAKSPALGIQANLTSELNQQFKLGVEITTEEQRSTELTLTNPSKDRYRQFALWHVEHLIKVDTLVVRRDKTLPPLLFTPGQMKWPVAASVSHHIPGPLFPEWQTRASAEFMTESVPHVTYIETGRT